MLGDIAVANGTYVLHHKAGSAQVDEKGVFTHVFERARSGWLCINSQRTVLREDSNAKTKKAVQRRDALPHSAVWQERQKQPVEFSGRGT